MPFLDLATINFIATLLSFTASVTAHPTANLIREPKDSLGLAESSQAKFAGAILNVSIYDFVTTAFVIPGLYRTDSTASSVQRLNAFVGLQCLSVVSAIVSFEISPNGTVEIFAPTVSPEVSFSVGDTAKITIEMDDRGYNTIIDNLTTGLRTTGHIPTFGSPVCLNNKRPAILGIDESNDDNSQSFVKFSSIEFYNTSARTALGGSMVDLSGATVQNIVTADGAILTSTTITSSNITISYLSG
ncbi:uncharacterized protein EI90DRAFT_3115837 [Cantharellus anzutake]|uniref:uncharacterized protein n=1 Tax=Cantharellus anzutake TaxID=1750568 RepID=UPI001906D427|nr:uncharacterized protein EI90DRAFT_3115837 [Cantharellus anzutake]KAF8341990.1 hypothetical protein EI90DRAFT_3115837 [Cantharellus anzutake]